MEKRIAELICQLEHLTRENEYQKKAIIKEILTLLPLEVDGLNIGEEYYPKEGKKNNYVTLEELSDQYNC